MELISSLEEFCSNLQLPNLVTQEKKNINIESIQQFEDWKNSELSLLSLDYEIENYLNSVQTLKENSDNYIQRIQKSLDIISDLTKNNEFVVSKTLDLQVISNSIITEKENLQELANDLELKLSYFNSLEMVIKLLSSSGQEICLEKDFIPSLSLLDHCAQFLRQNMDYQESGVYYIKTKQCLTRSMMIIKMHIVNTLRGIAGEIKDIVSVGENGKKIQISIHDVRFRQGGLELKPLISELEVRAHDNEEFMALLSDCILTFFNIRKALIGPYIQGNVDDMKHDSILEYSKTGCAYMIQICEDEYKLFHEYFEIEHEELGKYLESLSLILYDKYRPLILRENKIDELVELCQSLSSYFVDGTMDTKRSVLGDLLNPEKMDDRSGTVTFLARKTLEDVQARLVFRSQEFIQSEIMDFTPRVEDIELFARGRGLPMPNLVNSVIGVAPVIDDLYESDSDSKEPDLSLDKDLESKLITAPNQLVSGKIVYGGGEYYPTLQRTLYILGRMYGSIPISVFEEVSADAVDYCRRSLVTASDILAKKQTPLDGQLFLVKNLLMLREQIIPFDAEFIIKEERIDFVGMIETLASVLRSTWTNLSLSNITHLSRNLVDAASPKMLEKYSDARTLLDLDLKRICEDVILDAAKTAVEPISSFMLKVSAFRLRNASSARNAEILAKQNFASPEHVVSVFSQFKETLEKHLTHVSKKMNDYLGDKKTETILLRVIRSNILDNYQAFYEIVTSEYDSDYWNSVATVLDIAILIDKCTGKKSSLTDLEKTDP